MSCTAVFMKAYCGLRKYFFIQLVIVFAGCLSDLSFIFPEHCPVLIIVEVVVLVLMRVAHGKDKGRKCEIVLLWILLL